MLEGKETKARLENLQPWPNKGCELGGLGGGHSDDQLPLPTTQPDVRGGGRCTPHDDGMSTTRVSHQVLQYEGPYKGEMVSAMASHQN